MEHRFITCNRIYQHRNKDWLIEPFLIIEDDLAIKCRIYDQQGKPVLHRFNSGEVTTVYGVYPDEFVKSLCIGNIKEYIETRDATARMVALAEAQDARIEADTASDRIDVLMRDYEEYVESNKPKEYQKDYYVNGLFAGNSRKQNAYVPEPTSLSDILGFGAELIGAGFSRIIKAIKNIEIEIEA